MIDTNDRWWEQWDKDGIAQYIDDIWTKKDLFGFENLHRQNLVKLVSEYYKPDMKKVLEVGCGTGLIYQLMIKEVFDKSRYVGIDTSHEMLKIARSNFPSGKFEFGDAFAIDFKEKNFDLAFSFEVMIHLPEMETPVAELVRVSNKLAIFTTWVAKEEKITIAKLGDAEFIHHYYEHKKILDIIHTKAGNRPHRVEIRPLSDYTWAYIVLFDHWDDDQFLPFPGFAINFLSSVRKFYSQFQVEISNLQEKVAQGESKLTASQKNITLLEKNQTTLQQKLDKKQNEIEVKQKKHIETQKALTELQRRVFDTENKLLITQKDLSESHQILNTLRREKLVSIQDRKNSATKNILNFVRLFRTRESLENHISPAFQQLRDDSYLYNSSLKDYLLQPSSYINYLEFLPYQIKFDRANLSAILIAPILEIPAASGEIGIEIISPQNEIIRQTLLPLKNVNPTIPLKFSFIEIAETKAGTWGVRVFLKNADVPIQVFEWRKFSVLSKKFLKRKPFFGFSFTAQN